GAVLGLGGMVGTTPFPKRTQGDCVRYNPTPGGRLLAKRAFSSPPCVCRHGDEGAGRLPPCARRLGSWPDNNPFEFGLDCAKAAVALAEEIDAWPLKCGLDHSNGRGRCGSVEGVSANSRLPDRDVATLAALLLPPPAVRHAP